MASDKTKTLLFSISVGECYKNFAAFPGGLFELLEADVVRGALRIIFVVPKEKTALLEPVEAFAKRHPDRVVVETVTIAPRTTIQKIFAFLYSYFVYTGTTKTLATVGMRPNDAPGGGNRWLAPLKFALSKTFGRSRWIRFSVVPVLYRLFFPQRPFAQIVDTYEPDLVFVPDLFDRFDVELSREAMYRKIRRVGMVMNWDHLDKYFLPFPVEILFAQSDQMRRFAVEFQMYPNEAIRIVGYPFLDFVANKEYRAPREEIIKKLGFSPNAKYVLYIAGSMYAPDEPDVIEEMIKWADHNEYGGEDVYFVIRPYPGGRGKDVEFDEQKFNGFANHPRVSFQMEKFWAGFETNIEFMNIMRHADVLIQVFSTAVIPAAALDRPMITPSFDGHHLRPFNRSVRRFEMREHFKDVLESGGQQRALTFEELKEKLTMYLKHPETHAREREDMRQKVVGPLDGNASKRMHELLIKELDS